MMLQATIGSTFSERASRISASLSDPGFSQTSGILFLRHLGHDLLADLRRNIERRHVDRVGHVEHRCVRLQTLDLRLVRVDRDDGVALPAERPHRAIPELPRIGSTRQ